MPLETEFQVGETVMWSGGWGTEPAQPATITEFDEKNELPIAVLSNGHWAYLTQLEKEKGE